MSIAQRGVGLHKQLRDERSLSKDISSSSQTLSEYESSVENSRNVLEEKRDRTKISTAAMAEAEARAKSISDRQELIRRERETLQKKETTLQEKLKYFKMDLKRVNTNLDLLRSEEGGDDEHLKDLMEQSETEMSSAKKELLDLQSSKTLAETRHLDRLAELQRGRAECENLLRTIEDCGNHLSSSKGAKLKLNSIIQEFKSITEKKENLRHEQSEMDFKIESLHTMIQSIRNSILLNKCLTRHKDALKHLNEMRLAIDTNEIDKIIKSFNEASRNVEKLKNKFSEVEGEIKGITEFVRQFKTEREDVKYEKVQDRFYEANVEQCLQSELLDDLSNYIVSLDKALMQFHSEKLREINAVTKELWQLMYRGSDIEYVAIRSDTDLGDRSTGMRSYNYRVVMSLRGVEIDMRGRCSAGQKVLACIIIRLALAECFCESCSFLALDEPTTNLDRENIIGLGFALGSLINHRKRHSHFQLLIITHDDVFVEQLSRYGVTDHVVNVYKDKDGRSRLRRKMLREIKDI